MRRAGAANLRNGSRYSAFHKSDCCGRFRQACSFKSGTYGAWIGGKEDTGDDLVPSTFKVTSPATGDHLATVLDSSEALSNKAVATAHSR